MPATYGFYVDWDGDGVFDGTGEDVTSRSLLRRTPLAVRVGRDQARVLSPIAVGEADLELNNASRDYSPENTSSPLAGNVLPGRSVLFQATLSSTDYVLFRGHLDDFDVIGDTSRSVHLTCLDPLARLKGATVTTGLHNGLRTGEAIGVILDAVGWPADLRDIDEGATCVPWFWMDGADAYSTVTELLDSEGPGALLTVDSDGRIVFRDRHHRLTAAASLTSQATFRDTGTEPVYSAPVVYDHGWRDLVNYVTFNVPVRQPDGTLTAVWQSQEQIVLADGETVQMAARATSPFLGALTPVEGTDYTLESGAVTVGLAGTSGQSTLVTITATGGPAIVAGLQVRAYALATVTTRVVSADEPVSVGRYGRRSMPSGRDPVWAGVHDAAAIADLILAQRAERLPTLKVTVKGANDTRLAEQLGRDLSDRVTVVNAELGLNRDFYIEQISHTVSEGGKWHHTTFGFEAAPATIGNVFRFDTAGQGFDDGVFGGIGRDEPDTIFRFDVAGQGFDDGVFAT